MIVCWCLRLPFYEETARRQSPFSEITTAKFATRNDDNMSFSFKISRPPAPKAAHKPHAPSKRSQPVTFSDSEEEVAVDEAVVEFDSRSAAQKKQDEELVIAVAPDKDWRNSSLVRKRKEADMDVQVETRQGGLQPVKKKEKVEDVEADVVMEPAKEEIKEEEGKVDETEDQKALKELLTATTTDPTVAANQIGAIEVKDNAPNIGEQDELDAFRADVQSRPDSSTLEDYERVPVAAFGLALLRGMGLKKGAAMTPAYQPPARPAFLGIGAKPMADALELDDAQRAERAREERRKGKEKFVPLTRREKERDDEFSSSSAPVSRDRSRSASPRGNGHSHSSSRRDSRRSSPHHSSRRREIEYEESKYSRRDQDRGTDSRRERDSDSRQERGRDRERDSRKDKDRDRELRRDRDSSRERERRREKDDSHRGSDRRRR
ncbi:hypothetical protein BT69DRAFT_1348337 [Atractiella rhizophila]|nr:hypothetical protein BT69DRAFT_1348337 [Atractiella rhizophila]